ncbi:MAG TPA: hypothetical protein VJS12_07700 [Steroidobacteraceae bacterium]|nr:hypothetical protein [Steroidobacteraceae bacterium]
MRFAIGSLMTAATLLAPAANADCPQALAGFTKAQREARIAIYAVSSKDDKPTQEPWTVRIGDSVYINGIFNGLQPGFVKDDSTIFPYTYDFVSTQKRTVVCKVVGTQQYHGKPAIQIHVQRSDRDKGNVVWFDSSSGLPVYQEDDDKQLAFAFVYGDAVRNPVVGR